VTGVTIRPTDGQIGFKKPVECPSSYPWLRIESTLWKSDSPLRKLGDPGILRAGPRWLRESPTHCFSSKTLFHSAYHLRVVNFSCFYSPPRLPRPERFHDLPEALSIQSPEQLIHLCRGSEIRIPMRLDSETDPRHGCPVRGGNTSRGELLPSSGSSARPNVQMCKAGERRESVLTASLEACSAFPITQIATQSLHKRRAPPWAGRV
jgi:hypothetical protein